MSLLEPARRGVASCGRFLASLASSGRRPEPGGPAGQGGLGREEGDEEEGQAGAQAEDGGGHEGAAPVAHGRVALAGLATRIGRRLVGAGEAGLGWRHEGVGGGEEDHAEDDEPEAEHAGAQRWEVASFLRVDLSHGTRRGTIEGRRWWILGDASTRFGEGSCRG